MTKLFIILAIFIFSSTSVEAAALRLNPYEGSLNLNQQYELEVRLFTETDNIDSVDVKIDYTGNIIISDGETGVSGTNLQQTDLFENYVSNNVTSQSISLTAYNTTPINTATGYEVIAKIIFTPTQAGTITFDFEYTNENTNDSNVVESVSSQDILSSVRNASFTVGQSSNSNNDDDEESTDSSDSETENESSVVPTTSGGFNNVNVVLQNPQENDKPNNNKENKNEDKAKTNDDSINVVSTTLIFGREYVEDIINTIKENKTALTLLPAGLFVVSMFSLFSFYSLKDLFYLLLKFITGILKFFKYLGAYDEWGTVYDSKTKQPLDPVYVVLYNREGKKVDSCVTDINGRYGFLAKKGTYYITVTKTDYQFPSKTLKGEAQDYLYSHLYFGGLFTISKDKEIVKYNIPMDALKENWNEAEKQRVFKFNPKVEAIKKKLYKYGPIVALFTSTVVLLVEFSFYDLAITTLYYFVYFGTLKGKATNYGQVYDSNGIPASYASISVRYKSMPERELLNYVCDSKGRFYIIVDNNDYILIVNTHKHKNVKVNYKARFGIINHDLYL